MSLPLQGPGGLDVKPCQGRAMCRRAIGIMGIMGPSIPERACLVNGCSARSESAVVCGCFLSRCVGRLAVCYWVSVILRRASVGLSQAICDCGFVCRRSFPRALSSRADGSPIHPFVNAWRESGHVQAMSLHGLFLAIVPVREAAPIVLTCGTRPRHGWPRAGLPTGDSKVKVLESELSTTETVRSA